MRRKLTQFILVAAALAALTAVVAGCGSSSSGSSGNKIALVAYSTPQAAYAALIPAFQQTSEGKGVSFSQSYGASGSQSRAVAAGLPADVVAFSLSPDVTKLVKAGLVSPSWNTGPHKGIVTDSVVVLVVRKGTPKHITGWSDLAKPGVQVVTPNPFSSGSARWNIMAAYGSQIQQGKSPAEAEAYLKSLFKNVVAQDKSARDALQTFSSGKGDVLLSYENEAIAAEKKGADVQYIVPPQTILIENPVAVTNTGGSKAQAFVNFLFTPQAQQLFASQGYRPVIPSLVDPKKFPTPKQLFTIKTFGGWTAVTTKFFDPQSGIVAQIERSQGVSTASG